MDLRRGVVRELLEGAEYGLMDHLVGGMLLAVGTIEEEVVGRVWEALVDFVDVVVEVFVMGTLLLRCPRYRSLLGVERTLFISQVRGCL